MSNDDGFSHRCVLPCSMLPRNEVSIWAVLKNCVGKELSKITMPVVLNEPLSFLQRLSEYMEYAHILTEASKQEDPADRMKYIATFAVSALASNWERLGKPFNPLLGETFELKRNDYNLICEQVSHHPPISAFHSESPDFKFHGSIYPKIKFWGKSVEIQPKGVLTVELPRWDEAYTWTNVNCCVHNIIVGKLWIEQYGVMEIVNHQSGFKAILNFKSASWSDKDLHRVEGNILDKNNRKIYFLFGKWTNFMKCSSNSYYERYIRENVHLKKKEKTSNESSTGTPKKVFSKLNTFKMNSFRSLSIQDKEDDFAANIEKVVAASDLADSFDIPGSELLWKSNTRPDNSSAYYHFTTFALQLNEIEQYMKEPGMLCPTDSRLRPDIRYLENGKMDEASSEKTRLEEKQRTYKNQEILKPRWFYFGINPYTNQKDWLYLGGYWDRKYENIVDIF